ncbi:hypothetical protein GCM10023157_04470 [Gluconacetobacter asukensis]
MPKQKYDWSILDPQVDALLASGLTPSAAAAQLGMRSQTLRDRLGYRKRPKYPSPRAKSVEKVVVTRNCLSCRKPFGSDSRTRFMCPPCRSSAGAFSAHSVAQSGTRRSSHR